MRAFSKFLNCPVPCHPMRSAWIHQCSIDIKQCAVIFIVSHVTCIPSLFHIPRIHEMFQYFFTITYLCHINTSLCNRLLYNLFQTESLIINPIFLSIRGDGFYRTQACRQLGEKLTFFWVSEFRKLWKSIQRNKRGGEVLRLPQMDIRNNLVRLSLDRSLSSVARFRFTEHEYIYTITSLLSTHSNKSRLLIYPIALCRRTLL